VIIQQTYFMQYWRQDGKLGKLFDLIEWEVCEDFQQMLSPIQCVHVTKWVTGWMPVAKNMFHWKF